LFVFLPKNGLWVALVGFGLGLSVYSDVTFTDVACMVFVYGEQGSGRQIEAYRFM